MPDYRRYRIPGGTYFFTINLLERRSDLLIRHIEALREAVRRTRAERSFHIDGWVVLPDHLHCMLTLPPDDDDFSNRIKAIKIRFMRAAEPNERRSSVRIARGERGIWQRRFWEYAIRRRLCAPLARTQKFLKKVKRRLLSQKKRVLVVFYECPLTVRSTEQ